MTAEQYYSFGKSKIPGWKSSEPNEWKTWDPGRVVIKEFNVFNLGKGTIATWTAPRGFNNYLTKGDFKGCRPIIKPGARINTSAFEAIKFEML